MLAALLHKKPVYGATRQEVIVAREAVHKAIREVIVKDCTSQATLKASARKYRQRWQYKNPDAFWHHFTQPLGSGVFSIVVQHPTNEQLVIKLMTRNNDGAILWHSAVYDSMRRGCIVQGAIQVYHMEDNPHGHGAWCIMPKVKGFDEYSPGYEDRLPCAAEAADLAEELSMNYGFELDVHRKNIAYHRGVWVLTDPLAWSIWGRHHKATKLNTCTRAPCSGWQ